MIVSGKGDILLCYLLVVGRLLFFLRFGPSEIPFKNTFS